MDPLESPRFLPGCPEVRARLGTRFGINVVVEGDDKGTLVSELVTRVTHPPLANQRTMDEWLSPMRIGEPRYAGWIFGDEEELVHGLWAIEIVYGTEILARQEFNVVTSLHPQP